MSIDDVKAALDIHRDARKQGFNAGFLVACVELARTHGEDTLAFFLLRDAGITLENARDAGLDEDDIETITKVLTEAA